MSTLTKHIAYFVHDLTDAAVHRRTRMLILGGARVTVIGFRRSDKIYDKVEGSKVVDLGRTYDARLGRRVYEVAKAAVSFRAQLTAIADADGFIARNLEMLLLAVRARMLLRKNLPITYECLDVHRLQVSGGLTGQCIRALEASLCTRADLLITSSPAFITQYFRKFGKINLPIELVENKVLENRGMTTNVAVREAKPPWVIGWFGSLRCTRSLTILNGLVTHLPGLVKVVTAGRPASGVFSNFESLIDKSKDIVFLGPYRNPEDLQPLYSQVHFSWAIDYYEDGANSNWLLPNRLYEGGLYSAIPISLQHTETGRWLAEKKMGVLLTDSELSLLEFFKKLTSDRYLQLQMEIARLSRSNWAHDVDECQKLVSQFVEHPTHEPERWHQSY
jgi:succinoglycan biosynthesis protein ExoL